MVCQTDKITPANIQGPPDLVIEILSPSTDLKDRREKKALYERFGVRQHLLVSPEGRYVERYSLEPDGRYEKGEMFGGESY